MWMALHVLTLPKELNKLVNIINNIHSNEISMLQLEHENEIN